MEPSIELSFNLIDFYAFIVLLLLFLYTLFLNEIRGLQKVFIAFHLCMLMWPFGMFSMSTTENVIYQWHYLNLAFAGLSFLGFGWLVFSLMLMPGIRKLPSRFYMLFGLPAALACVLITLNPLHGLFAETRNGWSIDRTYGPVFGYLVAISFIYVLLGSVMMLSAYRKYPDLQFRKQISLLLFGQAFMLGFALLDTFFSVKAVDSEGLTSLGIVLSDLCFIVAMRKHNAFRIISVALREVVDSMDTGIVILDGRHNVIDRNVMANRFFAMQIGQPFPVEELLDGALEPSLGQQFLESYYQQPGKLIHTEVLLHKGTPIHVSVRITPIYFENGTFAGRVITIQDVTEWRKLVYELNDSNSHLLQQNSELMRVQQELSNANRMLEQMAVTDPLTGCFNRRYLFQMLEYQLAVEQRYQMPFSLLMFDVDHFKRINDTYGHHIGDEVLCCISEAVRGRLRDSDIFSRYGGEEFTVYLPHTKGEDALKVAEQLLRLIESLVISTDQGDIRVTISIGLISVPGESYNGENPRQFMLEMIRKADNALYQAKNQGRNRIVIA